MCNMLLKQYTLKIHHFGIATIQKKETVKYVRINIHRDHVCNWMMKIIIVHVFQNGVVH